MKVKICGITSLEETKFINEYKPDYIGMVLFFPKSKRNISIEKAKELMAAISSDIQKVAVTVSPSVEQIREICEAGFDVIQIHGTLEKAGVDACTNKIWKAFNVKDMDSFEDFADLNAVTGFVFDAGTPGSGVGFDYELLKSINRRADKEFILAGGLNPDNVAEAIGEVMPSIVDVSSGVEYNEGVGKDPIKTKSFIDIVRGVSL